MLSKEKQKMKRILLLTMVALAVGVFAPTSHAAFVLNLDDGLGHSVSITDEGAGDLFPSQQGVVGWAGSLGTWIVNNATGVSKPVQGAADDPWVHLNDISTTIAAGVTLTIMLTDTGFEEPSTWTSTQLISNVSGSITGGAGSYMTLNQILTAQDPADSLEVDLGPFTELTAATETFASSGSTFGGPISGPFSITELVTIHHEANGTSSFDMDSTVVPVPGAILLGFLGLGAAGLKLRRFA
jgi:hypothetical protein